jgi:hypothetical protein
MIVINAYLSANYCVYLDDTPKWRRFYFYNLRIYIIRVIFVGG